MFHAVMRAFSGKEAIAFDGRLQNFAQAIQLELVTIKNIVEQHDLLAQSNGDVGGHGDRCHHQIALIHQVDELRQRKMSQIGGAALLGDAAIFVVLVGSAQNEHPSAVAFQLPCQLDPILFGPQSGTPATAAARVQADDGLGLGDFPMIISIGKIAQNISFALEFKAADVEHLLGIAAGIGLVDRIENAREKFGLAVLIQWIAAIEWAQSKALFLASGNLIGQAAGFPIFIEIDQQVELGGLERQDVFQLEIQNFIHPIGWHQLWRLGEPGDMASGIDLFQLAQQRGGANDIASGTELDDQNSLLNRIVVGARLADDLFSLVRNAGDIAFEMAAILVDF